MDSPPDNEERVKTKVEEFNQMWAQILFDMNAQKIEIRRLRTEKSELLEELQSKSMELEALQNEMIALNEDRENMKTELRDVRNENDILVGQMKTQERKNQKTLEFAAEFLRTSTNGIVNSLPAFSEQMVLNGLTERPNSLNAFGSLVDMDMRLRPSQSKEETYHSTRLASGQTSNETYYDVGSHRSSLTNGSTGVRPKVQQNTITSTVPSIPNDIKEVLNETIITGVTESTNFYIDKNNHIRLKFVKVPVGKLMPVTMAYSQTPSYFWLHVYQSDVNKYIHVIQVKQQDLKNTPNSDLTAADISVGMYCGAIYSLDGYWYRAQIVGITYDHPIERDSVKLVRVLYIDWGNEEDRPLSSIMKLSHDLCERRQAVNCYIQGFGHRSKWPVKDTEAFEALIKDKRLKATFNRPHKVNEEIDSIVHPIDLMVESEEGVFVNLNEFLTVPLLEDTDEEEEGETNQTIVVTDQPNEMKEQSTDTVVCNVLLNGQSNPTLSATDNKSKYDSKQKSLEQKLKSKSNQNCAAKCNGVDSPSDAVRVPKSMPILNGLPPSDTNLTDIHRIPPPIIPDTMEGLIVETSHMESPSYIYLHIRDAQVGSAQFEDLEDSLNAFYSQHKPHALTQPQDVKEGSFWANRFSRDKKWYRSRVLQIEKGRALINYVDWGNEEWVDIRCLMPLTRQFANYPAMAVRSRLSNILPVERENWSEEALEFFQDLIANLDRNPPLTAFIAQKTTNFDFDSILEVFLWTIDSNEKDILVNFHLIVNKYATTDNIDWFSEVERSLREKTPPQLMSELIPIINNTNSETCNGFHPSTSTPKVVTTITPVLPITENGGEPQVDIQWPTSLSNGCHSNTKTPKNVKIVPELNDNYSDDEEWDPMAEDAICDNNNYNIRHNDAGIATLGFHPKERNTCKYYGTAGGCRAKDYCSFLHVAPDKRFALNDEEEEAIELEDLNLEKDSIVLFKMTSVVTPYQFYGVLPFGTIDLNKSDLSEESVNESNSNKELKHMSKILKNHYSIVKNKDNMNVFPGMGTLVAFRNEGTDMYYRGRVIHVNYDNKICTIFAVDLGIDIEVQRNHVFRLANFFRQLPALAIECSLAGIEPINSIQWSPQSIDVFTEWLSDRIVGAHIMYGRTDDKYYVDLITKEGEQDCSLREKLIELKFAQSYQTYVPSTEFSDEIYHSDSE